MNTNRREALGVIGAATAAATMAGATAASAQAARTLGSKRRPCSGSRAATPCDKNLKFDLGAFKEPGLVQA